MRPIARRNKRRRAHTPLFLAGALTLLACACAKKAAPDAPDATPARVVSAASPSPVSSSPAPSASSRADPMAAMFGNMAFELKNRPNLHPSADDAFAAFAKMNVGVKEPKQSIGKTYKARYCAHGVTLAKDLSVLICEYGSDADAAAGLAESKKLFPGMDTRQSYTHKSLLMVTHFQEANHGGPSTAAQQKLVTTFNGL